MMHIMAVKLWTLNTAVFIQTINKQQRTKKKEKNILVAKMVMQQTNERTIEWTTKIVNRIKSTWSLRHLS